MEIGTVDFGDLFDFSPEPVDVAEIGGSGGQAEHFPNEQPQPRPHIIPHPSTPRDIQDQRQPPHPPSERLRRPDFALSPELLVAAAAAGSYGAAAAAAAADQAQLSQSLPTSFANCWTPLAAAAAANSTATHGQAGVNVLSNRALNNQVVPIDNREVVSRLLKQAEESAAAAAAGEAAAGSSLGSEAGEQQRAKRGRKPGQKNVKQDMKSKLERSRQSARECRARKKLRYQYLDDMILEREKANLVLYDELQRYQVWCHELDKGRIPDGLMDMIKEYRKENT